MGEGSFLRVFNRMEDTAELLLEAIDKVLNSPGDIDEAQAWKLMLIAQKSVLSRLAGFGVRIKDIEDNVEVIEKTKINPVFDFCKHSKWSMAAVAILFIGLIFSIFTGQATITFN